MIIFDLLYNFFFYIDGLQRRYCVDWWFFQGIKFYWKKWYFINLILIVWLYIEIKVSMFQYVYMYIKRYVKNDFY